MMSKLFQRHHYEGSKKTTLEVRHDEESTTELKQVEFQDTSNEEIDGFSVVFEGPEGVDLSQGTYPVKHSEAGEGEVFLVPIQSKTSGRSRYELTVTNLKDEGDSAAE